MSDEIDLTRAARVVLRSKWLITSIVAGITTISIAISFLLPDVYRAEAVLIPNEAESGEGLAGLASQFGGLANIAGLDFGNRKIDKATLGLEILRSRQFLSDFITDHELLVPIIAANGWDRESKKLMIDSDIYDTASETWVREARRPRDTIPTVLEAYEELVGLLKVSQDNKSGIIRVSVDYYSPLVAKRWVDWLVADLNRTVMQRDVAQAIQAIEYLNEQIENTSLSELRAVFFRLVEEQTKIIVLAKVTPEYLLRTVDPAVVPEIRVRPNRLMIVAVTFILGLLFATTIVLLSHNIRAQA